MSDELDGASAVLKKIARMPEEYRSICIRLNDVIRTNGPGLSPRIWYGMPAYEKEGKVICFFRCGTVAKPERYITLGFSEEARLDDDGLWPIAFALTELTDANVDRLAALVKKAVS